MTQVAMCNIDACAWWAIWCVIHSLHAAPLGGTSGTSLVTALAVMAISHCPSCIVSFLHCVQEAAYGAGATIASALWPQLQPHPDQPAGGDNDAAPMQVGR